MAPGDTATLVAFWPVHAPLKRDWLIREAMLDLPSVAARAHARLCGTPMVELRPGRDVPGAGDVETVVWVEAPVRYVG